MCECFRVLWVCINIVYPIKALMHDVIWPACNPMTRGDSPHKLNILVIEWFTIYHLQSVRIAFLDADATPLISNMRMQSYYSVLLFIHILTIYKVKEEWCMIVRVCVIPIKIVIKHFWTLVIESSRRGLLCLTKRENIKRSKYSNSVWII